MFFNDNHNLNDMSANDWVTMVPTQACIIGGQELPGAVGDQDSIPAILIQQTSTAPYDWPQPREEPRGASLAGAGPTLYPWSWDAEPLAETPRLGPFKTVLQ
jgi:hypothetical protein